MSYLSIFFGTVDELLGELLESDSLLVDLHDAQEGTLVAGWHLPGQVEDVNGIGDGHLAVAKNREQSWLAGAVETEQTIAPATIKLEHRVLHELAAVEGDREVGDLDVATTRVGGKRARASARLRVQPGVSLEFRAQRLCWKQEWFLRYYL